MSGVIRWATSDSDNTSGTIRGTTSGIIRTGKTENGQYRKRDNKRGNGRQRKRGNKLHIRQFSVQDDKRGDIISGILSGIIHVEIRGTIGAMGGQITANKRLSWRAIEAAVR